jgi:P-type Ca2+ transporter type 2C
MEQLQFTGLSDKEVELNRNQFGSNAAAEDTRNKLWQVIKGIISEPMFIILVVAAAIYFILGETNEGWIMLAALCFVAGISIFQETRSSNAVEALKNLTQQKAKVIRNSNILFIPVSEVVVGDIILCEDGNIIPADAILLQTNDFSVNESMLTGEALSVYKSSSATDNLIFKGTVVSSGYCYAKVTAVGQHSALGKIADTLNTITESKTPLQQQMKKFIVQMVIAGGIAFIIVWGINYYTTGSILTGLLHGLTLAMSVLPEEIPVAFSTFLALGAYRLYKKGVITRSPQTVETLGAATVICTDKTGTLTENNMQIAGIYDYDSNTAINFIEKEYTSGIVLEYAMWASETTPFDTMEIAIHQVYGKVTENDARKQYSMVHEYPLSGTPPVMTHVFENKSGELIIGCKGAVETILAQSELNDIQKQQLLHQTDLFAQQGYRVLAVGKVNHPKRPFPEQQSQFIYQVLGLIAFYDPPKKNTAGIIQSFYKAGISVKMITGDHAATAKAIAQQIGLITNDKVLNGNEIMAMSEAELQTAVQQTNLFVRMFPQAKLKVVIALKNNGEVVAMTGDGVNDGPALKAAHIGIAMGKRGTETAKQAASLILTDDNLEHMVEAVELGRRIYENLKKAIRYIISIHIPIILIVTLPLLFFWKFADFFNPIHVIFLELIMGPTCSIIFENEPAEPGSMERKPRHTKLQFFSVNELSLSIIQGLVITAGCLIPAYFLMQSGYTETFIRTTIYSTLLFSNILLTLVNRSFLHSVIFTLKYKNRLVPLILAVSLLVLLASIYIAPIRNIFEFTTLTALQLVFCLLIASISVLWMEVYKYYLRKKQTII